MDYGNGSVDFIARLPIELSLTILRLLDDESLNTALNVCSCWKFICKQDSLLVARLKIYEYSKAKRLLDGPDLPSGYFSYTDNLLKKSDKLSASRKRLIPNPLRLEKLMQSRPSSLERCYCSSIHFSILKIPRRKRCICMIK